MARPEINGLKYFPFDVGFFADKKIRLLRGEHGADGVELYMRLLCKCYDENGYYLNWDDAEDFALLADEAGYSETKISAILATLLRRSLLCKLTMRGNAMSVRDDQDTLAEAGNGNNLTQSVTVLTSRGIQRRYFSAIKDTKIKAAAQGRHTTIHKDICLLTDDDFSELNRSGVWLKLAHNDSFSGINPNKSEINSSKSGNNPAKESKEKNNIYSVASVDKSTSPTKREIDIFFEAIWKLYPEKKGKGRVSDSKKKVLHKIGIEEISRCVERYTAGKPEWQKYQNGGTFFTSGYIDYLDENYQDNCTIGTRKHFIKTGTDDAGFDIGIWEDSL